MRRCIIALQPMDYIMIHIIRCVLKKLTLLLLWLLGQLLTYFNNIW